ncbi:MULTISPECIES: TetR/AcrR family transcriptional regulator [unclassified Streptomyces]|uniref:TetR/AcrR family transcriptional regulator n=1 Tax=unclassified Streptomyces TaxID=2593676 RepID=UPI0006AE2F30|nr:MULTISPECIES: TetR family transcriptional regulator [unclassified Streptomyces]KOX25610.1 TetR family transcriptional regulator [Streptomyces sp. NRRL F-6491]KOX48954.1 TetR family transcriptional regulator [Streptomyces sp. NRRL F-6492]
MTRFRESVRSLLREQVLDAAYRLVAAEGWSGLRMTSIARAAGISRQTLYNEFGAKEAIGNALVQRELEGFLIGIERELDAHRGELEAAAAAGVGYTLQQTVDNPLIKSVLVAARGGEDDLLAYLTTRTEPVFGTAMTMLDAYATEAWPDVDVESRGLAVETVVRLTVSHIVQPVASPSETAARIARITARIAYPGG